MNILENAIKQLGMDKTYWVAYSGGLDSHVLLMLCHELRQTYSIKLNAIYINHGLNPRASEWGEHCQRVCDVLQIPFINRVIQVDTRDGRSMEEGARDARYAMFAEYIDDESVLLTAHHQDDQAETVLLQLARGAGLKGLSAMPSVKSFSRGLHARPLLSFTREQLHQFANECELKWIDDESNSLTTIARNFLRHDIFSLLKSRWPAIAETFSRSALHCAEAQKLLDEYGVQDCLQAAGSREGTLSVSRLQLFTPERVRHVLRTWIQSSGFPLPDMKKLTSIQQDVMTAAWDRSPCVEWKGVELRRYRDDLYLMAPLAAIDVMLSVEWSLASSLVLPGIGELHAVSTRSVGLRANVQQVSVRYRQGGETICLPKRGRHTLKNLFQEWDVLPWLRDRIPLLYVGEQLVSVIGYAVDERFGVGEGEEGWEVMIENAFS